MHNKNDRDTADFEKISPAKIEITRDRVEPTVASTTPYPAHSRLWLYLAFTGLLMLAFAVFFLLPRMVPQPEIVLTDSDKPGSATADRSSQKKSRTETASPWLEAQHARERKAAQDILQEMLDKQFQLEEMRVGLWASESFERAKQAALKGDDDYRERGFSAAINSYQEALSLLGELLESVPEVQARLREQGNNALLEGNTQAANTAFNTLQQIDPLSVEASIGLARAETLDQVLAMVAQSRAAEQSGKLDEALQQAKEALFLDAKTPSAQEALTRISGKIKERDFTIAMSAGYAALERGGFANARREFGIARKLKPVSVEARDALDEAEHRIAQIKLTGYRNRAEKLETLELWSAALDAYQRVLKLDNSVIFAQEGRKRTEPRAKLDAMLQDRLGHPERLSNDEVYREGVALLKAARLVAEPGPRLRGQIAQFEVALQLSKVPVRVQLKSDNQTEVTLYKVGNLGNFSSQQLSLKPGRYTLVGKRSGYRDVRKEFIVTAKKTLDPIVIQCVERI